MKGVFIALEGPDGCGKSTILKYITQFLTENNIKWKASREPGGTKIGEKIREILISTENKKMTSETEALLLAAQRAQHLEELIKPSIEEGYVVILDRFIYSSLAYQGFARGIGIKKVEEINDFGINGTRPDLTLLFQIDPMISIARKFETNEPDRLESEGVSFQKKVVQGYDELSKQNRPNIEYIDASLSEEETAGIAINYIKDLLLRKGIM